MKKIIVFVAVAICLALSIASIKTYAHTHGDYGIVANVYENDGDYFVDIYNYTANAWDDLVNMDALSEYVDIGDTLTYSDGFGGWVAWNYPSLTLQLVWDKILEHYTDIDFEDARRQGIIQGFENGYKQAKEEWSYKSNGVYYTGTEAYNNGVTVGSSEVNSLAWLRETLFLVGSLFTLQMLPGVTIGSIALIVIAVKLIPWLIGLMKGGKND